MSEIAYFTGIRGMRVTEETALKGQVKQYLAIRGIFNYPVHQGLGSYAGLPDRCMHWRGEVYYLEIKKPGGKLSRSQQAFQEQCRQDNIHYHVIRDLDDLIEVTEQIRKMEEK